MELLTIQEAAELMRVSPMTVRRRIDEGRLMAVRVGRGVRVSKEALDSFVKPVEPKKRGQAPARPRAKLFTREDSLFNIIGIAESGPDEPTDVSANKLKYLAEAYAANHR